MDLLYTAHVPAGDGPFPTVVVLHGWGASAHDLIGLAPVLNRGAALVLSPQGPLGVALGEGVVGHGWFPIGEGPPAPGEIERAGDRLRAFLDAAARRYPIAPRKQALLGFSQGGVLAYELALREPRRFAGVAALSAWLPEEVAKAAASRDELETLPVLIVHGSADRMVPLQLAHEARDRLRQLGASPSYREHDMDHEIRPEALRDLVGWLDGKVLNPIQLL